MEKELNWKDELKERSDNYNHKVSEITSTLRIVVGQLKVPPYNLSVEVKLIENTERLTWEVKIGKHYKLFYINDFNLGIQPSGGEIDSLEERVQVALLEKFKFELK
ncbi:hypothetical protein NSA56_01960 [Oceanobacillus caeni]|uniref:hypothetical protein n=1 Tax=Bacillaceae TaxID=186817 RepID=UPI0011A09C0D|nr:MULTISPECIES: hypothetical protein [Bacillaceae]MCR1833162.1 hypothetical protein [Oceanobacillus caeni]